jgi:hypothetical protein
LAIGPYGHEIFIDDLYLPAQRHAVHWLYEMKASYRLDPGAGKVMPPSLP